MHRRLRHPVQDAIERRAVARWVGRKRLASPPIDLRAPRLPDPGDTDARVGLEINVQPARRRADDQPRKSPFHLQGVRISSGSFALHVNIKAPTSRFYAVARQSARPACDHQPRNDGLIGRCVVKPARHERHRYRAGTEREGFRRPRAPRPLVADARLNRRKALIALNPYRPQRSVKRPVRFRITWNAPFPDRSALFVPNVERKPSIVDDLKMIRPQQCANAETVNHVQARFAKNSRAPLESRSHGDQQRLQTFRLALKRTADIPSRDGFGLPTVRFRCWQYQPRNGSPARWRFGALDRKIRPAEHGVGPRQPIIFGVSVSSADQNAYGSSSNLIRERPANVRWGKALAGCLPLAGRACPVSAGRLPAAITAPATSSMNVFAMVTLLARFALVPEHFSRLPFP